MNAKDAIRQVIDFGHMLTHMYIEDLTDAELMTRAVPASNHVAWQVGHLICSDHQMLSIMGCTPPVLSQAFINAHTSATASSNDPGQFFSKVEYLTLKNDCKTAAMKAVDDISDSDLDAPAPDAMKEYAPTMGAALMMLGNHWLMHAGQFVPIRRKLGKPPLF